MVHQHFQRQSQEQNHRSVYGIIHSFLLDSLQLFPYLFTDGCIELRFCEIVCGGFGFLL